jgi:hypothetical protein
MGARGRNGERAKKGVGARFNGLDGNKGDEEAEARE